MVSDTRDPRGDSPNSGSTKTIPALISKTIEFLQSGEFPKAYTTIVEAENLCIPPIRDLGYLKGICLIKMNRVPEGVHALESELARFPDHEDARALLNDYKAQIVPLPVRQKSIGPIPSESVRRILFIRADSIGDNVLASSILPPIAAKFPEAEIAIICQDHIQDLYADCPYVKQTIGFNWKLLLENESYRATIAEKIRGYGADLLLNSIYSRDPVMDLLSSFSEAKRKVAFQGDLSNATKEIRAHTAGIYSSIIESKEPALSELERHQEFLSALGVDSGPLSPQIWIPTEEERAADSIMSNPILAGRAVIALFPTSQYQIKDYPGFEAALKGAALDSKKFAFLSLGSKKDRVGCDSLLKTQELPGLNLCGETSIRLAAALLKRCRLAVGSDTAHAHIACAVGTPQVVVVGGGHFGRFLPYSPLTTVATLPLECFGCSWRCPHSRPHCVTDLSPRVVTAAINSALNQRESKARIFVQSRAHWEKKSPEWADPGKWLSRIDAEIIEV